MSFGKLGAMGRGFGHLGALGRAGTSTPAGSPYSLHASVGSFILTGDPMTPLVDYKLPSDLGTFVETGQNAGFLRTYTNSAAVGAFTLAGQDATLTYTSGATFSVTSTDSDGVSPATTSNTFTAKSIGVSDSSRKVLVYVGVRGSTAQASSVTVDGVAATFVDKGNIGAGNDGVEAWIASVGASSGHTTGNVVVNYASAPTRIGISIYNILGSTSSIVSTNSNGAATPITSPALTVPAGGSLIVGVFGRGATAPTFTWSGAFSSASDVSTQPGSQTGTLATGHSAPGAATGSQTESATPSVSFAASAGIVAVGLGP